MDTELVTVGVCHDDNCDHFTYSIYIMPDPGTEWDPDMSYTEFLDIVVGSVKGDCTYEQYLECRYKFTTCYGE